MYNVGIFEIIPEVGQTPITGIWPNGVYVPLKPITPTVLLRAGLLEIINKTPYDIAINLAPGGTLVQEANSKCIYRLVQSGQGLTITLQPSNTTSNNGLTNILVTPPNNVIIINNYEPGEIDWYPPVSLNPEIPALQQQFGFLNYQCQGKIDLNSGSFTVPASGTSYQTFLLGFDLTVGFASAVAGHQLNIVGIISNYFQGAGNNALQYQIVASTNVGYVLNERFPVPLLINGTTGATFSFSSPFTGIGTALNVYWLIQ